MTLLTRANRAYLNKVAPQVGDRFTVVWTYHIKPAIRRARDGGEAVFDDRYRFEGDRHVLAHLDQLKQSGHLRLMEETKTRRFVEKPLKKGGPPIYFEAQVTETLEFVRRK